MSEHNSQMAQSELIESLRAYLPSPLQRQCLLETEVGDSQPCVQHLDALLHTMSTYLPRQVVVPLTENPQRGRVEGGFTRGTVMFADISGFTAMSESSPSWARRVLNR